MTQELAQSDRNGNGVSDVNSRRGEYYAATDVTKGMRRVMAWFGVSLIDVDDMISLLREKRGQLHMRDWAHDQIRMREALVDLHEKEVARGTRAPYAARMCGLSDDDYRAAIVQAVLSAYIEPINALRMAQRLRPGVPVAHTFPRPVVACMADADNHLFAEGHDLSAGILRTLIRKTEGILAIAAHTVFSIVDEFRGVPVPDDRPLVIWPSVPGELDCSENDRFSVRRFSEALVDIFPATPYFFYDAKRAGDPPIWRLRRTTSGRAARVLKTLSANVLMALGLCLGDWRSALLARHLAVLPRARAMLDRAAPAEIAVTLSWMTFMPLWVRLARAQGARLTIACYSTQVRQNFSQAEHVPNVVPGLYMFIDADRLLAWDDVHKSDLIACGAEPSTVEVVGPVIFSTRPARDKRINVDKIIVDFFDQPPENDWRILTLGTPEFYHSEERCIRALEDLLEALEQTLTDRPWCLRLKMKKAIDPWYSNPTYVAKVHRLVENAHIEMVDPRTSPLHMHAQADLTIGFPFVSPVVSADWMGCPAAFFDPTGEVFVEGEQARHIPVLQDRQSLETWIQQESSKLETMP